MPRSPLPLVLALSSLIPLAAHAETVWWEAENAADTTMPADGLNSPRGEDIDKISDGRWLSGPVGEGLYADYKVTVKDGGKYDFMVRRFWLHGAFRWRFDEQSWVSVEDLNQTVLDQEKTSKGPATWVDLGYVTLPPGEHQLRIEIVSDSKFQFNKTYAFDCFVLSNEGFVPQGTSKEGGPHKAVPQVSRENDGRYLGRTMALLESATPEHRTPVTIFFYGQSIIQNSNIDQTLLKFLREKYPNARISYQNRAIGGYQAPILRRTSWQDLYPQNADLIVFHDYGGENGELEEMFKGIRDNMTADVITWTHHIDNFGSGIDQKEDAAATLTQQLGEKYGLEVADARSLWKERLKETHEPRQNYLVDQIHLNPKGTALLAEALTPHFRVNPSATEDWKKRVLTIPLDQPSPQVTYDQKDWTVADGGLVSHGTSPLRITFTGNRADLVALPASKGTARILLDGKAPSTERETLAASRSTLAPGCWWPAITKATLGDNAVPETITMNFRDVAPDASSFAFDVHGSVSGDEGSGESGKDFTARSGRYTIKAEDIALDTVKKITHKDLAPQLATTWDVYSMSKDTWKSPANWPAGFIAQDTVVRSWKTGPHVLEIVPVGDGPVALKEVMTFSPHGQD